MCVCVLSIAFLSISSFLFLVSLLIKTVLKNVQKSHRRNCNQKISKVCFCRPCLNAGWSLLPSRATVANSSGGAWKDLESSDVTLKHRRKKWKETQSIIKKTREMTRMTRIQSQRKVKLSEATNRYQNFLLSARKPHTQALYAPKREGALDAGANSRLLESRTWTKADPPSMFWNKLREQQVFLHLQCIDGQLWGDAPKCRGVRPELHKDTDFYLTVLLLFICIDDL